MKKTILFKTMLLLCAMLVGNAVNAADKWVKTDPTNFSTGDVVVIVDQTSSTAMSNDKGTSSAPAATTVSLNNDKSEITSEVATTLQWVVTVTNNTYQFGVGENYLYCTSSNNGVRVGSNSNNVFTWVADPNNTNSTEPFLVNSATSRYIGVYNSQDWRCYTSINTNIKTTVTAFYKKTASVDPDKENVTLSFEKESYNADIAAGTTFNEAELTNVSSVAVTYSSSKTSVATVDEESGVVTLVGKGVTTITASFDGDDTYNPASASYTLTVTNSNANDGSLEKPFTVAEAIEFIIAKEYDTNTNYYVKGIISRINGSSPSGGKLTYFISDDGTTTNELQVFKGKNLDNTDFTDVSDIEVGDNVTIVGEISYYNNVTPQFNQGNYIYSTNHKTREVPELIVEEGGISMEVTTTKPVEDVYETNSDGAVTVSSRDESIVKVEDGLLKAVSVGSVTITVEVAQTDNFTAATAYFIATVTAKEGVAPEGQGAGAGYFLVTDASTLKDGDKLLIVGQKADGSTYVMAGQGSTNRAAVSVSINNGIISQKPETAQEVILEGQEDAWYFNVGEDKYLYAAGGPTGKNNHLKTDTKEVAGDNAKATIEIAEDGASVVVFQGDANRNVFQFNPSGLFSCYANTQNDIYFYRYSSTNATFNIAVSAAGWRGLVTAVDATLPETLTAYTVTAYNESTATLTKVDAVKANTPYIVKGNEGTYTLAVAEDEVEAPVGNLLQISTKNTGNGVYVLYNGASGVGFYLWSGGSLGAGRVYLPATTNAREFIGFETETTGISTVNGEAKSLFNGEFFNMAGQRVAKPAKGLYIVNGKKVVIK